MALLAVLTLTLTIVANALPHPTFKREASQLRSKYDFVIVGGGTSGLTVADRLSQAFPKSKSSDHIQTVLVVEYGEVEYAEGSFDPPTVWQGGYAHRVRTWTFNSLPNPEVNNKTALVIVGQVVGGSSAANGMFFDRPSRFDYEAWDELANYGSDGDRISWDWDGIFPYYRKSVTFTEPSKSVVKQYGYTWDLSAFSGSTPIYASYPSFQWADMPIRKQAYQDLGIPLAKECAGGDKSGLCWVPTSEHPVTSRRSHSGLGHYIDVVGSRSNYDLIMRHQVTRVVYPKGPNSGPPRVEVRSLADNNLFNITVKGEVVISAGALHTPTILHRSGIGPASVLRSARIPLVLDLPGVGSNLQDHAGTSMGWNYTKPGTFSPLPSDMLDPTFAAAAAAAFNATPATGPYTLAMGNIALYLSLPNLAPRSLTNSILFKIRTLLSAPASTLSSYLPPDIRTIPSLIAGYRAQLSAIHDLLSNPDAPSLETPWATGSSAVGFLLHPLSRGTVRLNVTHPLEQPILDYRSASNPIDMDMHIAHIKFLRKLKHTPTFRQYGAVEILPGEQISDDDEEALKEYIREQVILSLMHPCCTAAMMPRDKGGVVGTDLKVHGAEGLRVVDISVLPVLVSSHTSSTAYAVGEKAADIMIKEWRRKAREH